MVQNWMSEFYGEYFPGLSQMQANANSGASVTTSVARREVGVYVFPRFIKPGTLMGQGWLYTANSTKEIFESSGVSGTSSATAELISDEVYPVGPVDAALTDI